MKIEKFPRHKSNQGYLAAKYPTVIMYGLSAVVLLLPGVHFFAWLIAFVFFFREKDSIFLRLHSASIGLLLLFRSMVQILLVVLQDFIFLWASRSQSNAAILVAVSWAERFNTFTIALLLSCLAIMIVQTVMAYNYRYFHLPVIRRLAKRLEENTRPGPLR